MPELNFQPISSGQAKPVTTPTVTGGSSTLGTLGSDAFLKLFVAQLKYQNPMEPMDATQMLQQTSQFTQVETLQKLNESQSTIMGYQQMSTATALIGKDVTALVDGVRTTGVVDRVQVSASGPILVMGDQQIPLTEVVSVGTARAASSGTTAPTSSAGSTPSPSPTANSTP